MGDHAVVGKRRGSSSTGDEGEGTGDRAVTGNRPRASDDDEAARALPPGAMSDNLGRMCKLDAVGRLYEVDVDGVRVTKRGTTRPKGFSPDEWGRKSNIEKLNIRKGLGLDLAPSSSSKRKPPEKKSHACDTTWIQWFV